MFYVSCGLRMITSLHLDITSKLENISNEKKEVRHSILGDLSRNDNCSTCLGYKDEVPID